MATSDKCQRTAKQRDFSITALVVVPAGDTSTLKTRIRFELDEMSMVETAFPSF